MSEGDSGACAVYTELATNLATTYIPRSFTYTFEFENLKEIIDLYKSFINALFKETLFEYIETLYNGFKAGIPPIGPLLGLMNLQLTYFIVLGVLVLLLVVSVLSVVLRFVCAAASGVSYQKISSLLGAKRVITAFLLFLLTIFIAVVTLIGMTGIMQWQKTKIQYEIFTRDASSFLKEYTGNITDDMSNMSGAQFDFMLKVLEDDIYQYQELAAEAVKSIEKPYADVFNETAYNLEDLEISISEAFAAIEPSLSAMISKAEVKKTVTSTCYSGVKMFCEGSNGETMCDDIFNAYNAEPIFDLSSEWIAKDNFQRTVDDYDIPTMTKTNWELWNTTGEDLMEYNKPLRDQQKLHHEGFKQWLQKNTDVMTFRKKSWSRKIDAALPQNEVSYMSTDTSGLKFVVTVVRWVMASLQIAAFIGSIFSIIVISVGLCMADPTKIPTERSSISNTIAVSLKMVSVFFSILLMLVLAVTIPFFVISSIMSQTCTETDAGKNPFWLWDNKTVTETSPISNIIGIEGDILFKDFLSDCKNNKPLFDVFDLGEIWKLEERFLLGDFLDFLRVVEQSSLNPHDHGYSDFYSTSQRQELEEVLDITSNNYTGVGGNAPRELVAYSIYPRGLIRVAESDLDEFKAKATAARNMYSWASAEDSMWQILNTCISNVDDSSWVSLHAELWPLFAAYRELVADNALIESLVQYRKELLKIENPELSREMFFRSSSTYQRVMKESLVVLENHVACYRDMVTRQYREYLGRCRPLYDIYEATKNFICSFIARSTALVTFSFLLLSVSLVLFNVLLSLSVPLYQRMSKLHPDDEKQFERQKVANMNKTNETDI